MFRWSVWDDLLPKRVTMMDEVQCLGCCDASEQKAAPYIPPTHMHIYTPGPSTFMSADVETNESL